MRKVTFKKSTIRKYYVYLASFLMMTIYLTSIPAHATVIGQDTKDIVDPDRLTGPVQLDKKVIIMYDPSNELFSKHADSIFQSIHMVYLNTALYPVATFEQMSGAFDKNQDPFIVVWAFDTNLEGIKIADEIVKWETVAKIVAGTEYIEHILSVGNVEEFIYYYNQQKTTRVNFYYQPTSMGVVDLKISYFFTVWTISDLFLKNQAVNQKIYRLVGETLQTFSLKFFETELNDLMNRQVEPKSPVGEENLTLREEKMQELRDAHPAMRTGIKKIDRYDKRQITPPLFFKNNAQSLKPSDILLSVLPEDSGLQGPIGFILDFLFKIMNDKGDGEVYISEETLEVIFNAFQVIKSLIGGNGFDAQAAASALKGLLNLILNEFPFGEQLLPYMELMIDGLFTLKGDAESITAFIKSLLDLVIPGDVDQSIRTVIDTIIDTTAGVIQQVAEGENFLTALSGSLLQNLMSFLIEKLLSDAFGLPSSKPLPDAQLKPGQLEAFNAFTDYKAKLDIVIQILIDLIIAKKDIVDVLVDKLDDILIDVFGLFSEGARTNIQKLAAVLAFGYSILNTGKYKLLDRAKALFTLLVPSAGAVANQTADKVVEAIGAIREAGTENWAPMKTLIDEALGLLEPHVGDADLFNLITAAVEWVFGVLNDGLPDDQRELASGLSDVVSKFFIWSGLLESSPNFKPDQVLAVNAFDNTQKIIDFALGIYSLVKKGPEQAQKLFSKKLSQFKEDVLNDPFGKVVEPLMNLIFGDNNTLINSPEYENVKFFGELALGTFKMIAKGELNSFESIMQLLISVASTGITKLFPQVNLEPVLKIMGYIFPDLMGVEQPPSPFEAVTEIMNIVLAQFPGMDSGIETGVRTVLEIIISAREIFTNGIQWLFGQIIEWLGRQVEELINNLLTSLIESIGGSAAINHNMASGKPLGDNTTVMNRGLLSGNGTRSKLTASEFGAELISYKIPAEFGGFSLFDMEIFIGLKPNFDFDTDGFKQLLSDAIFKGKDLFKDGDDIGAFFAKLFSFFSITPVVTAGMSIGNMDSGKNNFFAMILKTLGLEIHFEGKGWFAMSLFTIGGSGLRFDNFLKIVEWGLKFTITISKTLTLLDFLTAGVGGGVLNSVAEFLGLGGISVTISIGIAIEIIKRAASDTGPEEATFQLDIIIGVVIDLEISLYIVGIHLWGGVEITLSFFQDLAQGSPLQIFLTICFFFGVALQFLFTEFGDEFEWCPVDHEELTPGTREEQETNGAKGFDTDKDGLGDEYEKTQPGLDFEKADSDGDGLTDKQETQFTKTDASRKDTDGDGLDDKFEVQESLTDPRNRDSDYDGLTDFDEVMVYKTNANQRDTDGDGLDDQFEVKHSWNITAITPSVTEVTIGNKKYNDHTDPLDPDTDGDGLLDGQEGERGPWYGNPLLRLEGITEDSDLVAGGGFTHPLDSDTDDDSYSLLINGSRAPISNFLHDMNDKIEIDGQDVIFWVDGEPELRRVRTNPVRPDSDGDTGLYCGNNINCGVAKENAPINIFLNSDGYELSLTPPTDPMDGDTDDDGIMDGLEGVLFWASNRTNPTNPDTDGDGLGDLQELLLGSSALDVDTDNDMVADGDEYIKFGTSVFLPDTDFDGVLDGQELFWFHTSPFLYDSDGDGIGDAAEIFDYFTDPNDDDSDRDFVSDYDEIMIYGTLPNDEDTDNDGLLDGIEIFEANTDPFVWDTDNDSINYLDPTSPDVNQDGDPIALRWGDYEEYMAGSDPTSSDMDKDGISDAWETYLGSGRIPNFTPIPLNRTNPDTDYDGLRDGQELLIINHTSLIYPFIGYYILLPYNSSPVKADTDYDGLDDYTEIMVIGTSANNVDTDNDTLTDYEEVQFHETSPLLNDTDGDGLADFMEVTQAVLNGLPTNTLYNTTYKVYTDTGTNATNPDTDGDLLPDGAELYFYFNLTKQNINVTYDPRNPDQLDKNGVIGAGNGIPDGLDLDNDYDGLPDGYEFMGANYNDSKGNTYNFNSTYMSNTGAGGPLVPDSDYDSLPDGLEVYNLFTDPTRNDTDNDGFSDGLEERIHTDPLVETSWSDFAAAMNVYKFIKVASPVSVAYNGKVVPIKVNAPEDASQVTYRIYKKQDSSWSPEIGLTFDQGWQSWITGSGYQLFEAGNYLFRSNIYNSDGSIETNDVFFAVLAPYEEFDIATEPSAEQSTPVLFLFTGLLAGLGASLMVMQTNNIGNVFSKFTKRKVGSKLKPNFTEWRGKLQNQELVDEKLFRGEDHDY